MIAGNWKMNKTVAEAEAFIEALLPQVGAVEDVEVVICPPFTALQAMVDSARGSAVARLRADHARGRRRRVHRRGVGADADRARGPGRDPRALRAAPVLRRDRPRAAAEGPGGPGGGARADPLRRRDRGGARARRHRAQAAPPGPGGARQGRARGPAERGHRLRADLGDRHGPVATPEQAQEAVGFVRALVGAFDKRRAGPCASSTAARSSPTTPPSCWRCPTSTARSSAGSLEPESFAAIVEAARGPRAREPRPAVCLVVLDGWGLAPAGRATRSRWPTRRCSTSCGRAARTRR